MNWIGEAIPRTHFGKDLLFSFGLFLTICRIQRNNAEQRIAAMRTHSWKPETQEALAKVATATTAYVEAADADLHELARDQIAVLVFARFKGFCLTRLVVGKPESTGLHYLPKLRGGRRRCRHPFRL